MTAGNNNNASAVGKATTWCAVNRHFVIATVIMALAAGGWGWAVEFLGWVTHKESVDWPAGVTVNSQTFQLTSLPIKMGPYELATDGMLQRNKDGSPKLDGNPDGERIIEESVMEALKIGTALDRKNVSRRRSNWYVTRIYVDTRRTDLAKKYRFWQLNMYYYTGGLDKVPHVAEICLQAGGSIIVANTIKEFDIPGDRKGWTGQVPFRRVTYEDSTRANKRVLYYVFSMNGKPETNRQTVRLKLANPFVKHCYFTKIEISPILPIMDPDEADRAAQEAINYFMPSVLKTLPTSEHIKELDAGDRK